MTYEVDWQTEK